MNSRIEWRVAPEHVGLLPTSLQAPSLPTNSGPPTVDDFVQMVDGRWWVVVFRHWKPMQDGTHELTVTIEPAPIQIDSGWLTLH